MPTVTRVKAQPVKPSRNGARGGSLLAEAIDAADLPVSFLKLLVYGQNRVGKTKLSCEFAKPLLLVSFEPSGTGGAETIRKVPGVRVLQVRSTDLLSQLAAELADGGVKEYRTVVWDSATSLQDIVLAELLNLPSVPDQLGWGTVNSDQYRARSEKTKEMLRKCINLPVDTIITAKEKDHNPPKEERTTASGKVMPDMRPKFLRGIQQESHIAAELGGATAGWLNDACDAVVRLFVEEEIVEKHVKVVGKDKVEMHGTGRYIRYLRMRYHPNFAAGVRSCDPDGVPEVMVNPSAEKILKVLRG